MCSNEVSPVPHRYHEHDVRFREIQDISRPHVTSNSMLVEVYTKACRRSMLEQKYVTPLNIHTLWL